MSVKQGDTVPAEAVRLGASEKQFMQAVIDYATGLGWWCFHPHDSRRSRKGWPDLALIRPPRILYVECKSAVGLVTDEQWDCLARLRACDQFAEVWRPSDWRYIERVLA